MMKTVLTSNCCRRKVNSPFVHFFRAFHDYFVTQLPSSSLHPDSRSSSGPGHQLPRSASEPHIAKGGPSPAPLLGTHRDTTVVRIPLRSAKHHFGVSVSRGSRPYNEDSYQAGVVEIPSFAKKSPLSVTRAPASSPLQAYREGQQKQRERESETASSEEATGAEGTSGDPQVFYFGVFDGHGGTECSGYLRENLHTSIEEAAKKYKLPSTLRNLPIQDKQGPQTSEISTPANPGRLNAALMSSWRENVGGYFRRFNPPAFAVSPARADLPTILTHAFLQTDLSFLLAQLRRSNQSADLVAADQPLNAHDDLHSPSHLSRQHASQSSNTPFKGGSTASIALIATPTPTPFWHPSTPSTLYTAHCGDTRILLSSAATGLAVPMTTNHHPAHPTEASRLRRYATSFVTDSFGEERMSGLANTRSFGDMPSKRMGVSAEPEIRRTDLSPGEYSFMVLVSDGVTNAAGDQEIVDIVKEARTPEEGARAVVGYATEVGEDGDNATAIVVRMGGWERRLEGGKGALGTREDREWKRKDATEGRGRRMT